MQRAECGFDTDSQAQEPRHFHRPWKEVIERLTARIEQARHLPTMLGEGQGPARSRLRAVTRTAVRRTGLCGIETRTGAPTESTWKLWNWHLELNVAANFFANPVEH